MIGGGCVGGDEDDKAGESNGSGESLGALDVMEGVISEPPDEVVAVAPTDDPIIAIRRLEWRGKRFRSRESERGGIGGVALRTLGGRS